MTALALTLVAPRSQLTGMNLRVAICTRREGRLKVDPGGVLPVAGLTGYLLVFPLQGIAGCCVIGHRQRRGDEFLFVVTGCAVCRTPLPTGSAGVDVRMATGTCREVFLLVADCFGSMTLRTFDGLVLATQGELCLRMIESL